MVQMWQKTLTDRTAVQEDSVQCRNCLQWFLSHLSLVWLERIYTRLSQDSVFSVYIAPAKSVPRYLFSVLSSWRMGISDLGHLTTLWNSKQTAKLYCLVWVCLGWFFLGWASDLHYRWRSAHRSHVSPVPPPAFPDFLNGSWTWFDISPWVMVTGVWQSHLALPLAVPSLVTLALSSWCLEEQLCPDTDVQLRKEQRAALKYSFKIPFSFPPAPGKRLLLLFMILDLIQFIYSIYFSS